MENNDSRSDQPPPTDTLQPKDDREPVRFKIWQLEWSGPLPPLLALVFGLGIGVVLFYLSMFEFQRPRRLYDFLIEDPSQEKLSAWQTHNPPPAQPEEIVKTVVVTEVVEKAGETVVVTEVVEVVVTEIVTETVEITVVVTPTPTPLPETHTVLESDLRDAFSSAAVVIQNSADNEIFGWNDNQKQTFMTSQLEDNWRFKAKERVIQEMLEIFRYFTEVTIVEWEVEALEKYKGDTKGKETVFRITDFSTYLRIGGVFVCPDTSVEISIAGDKNPIEFVSDTVVVFDQYNQHYIKYWYLEKGILTLLNEYCQSSD